MKNIVKMGIMFVLLLHKVYGGALDELQKKVLEDQKKQEAEVKSREERFLKERDQQVAKMQDIKAKFAAENARFEKIKSDYESNEKILTELEGKLKISMGTLNELFGVARQVAGDTAATLETSVTSAQYHNRITPLKHLADSKEVPSIKDLENLWISLLNEIVYSGQISKFKSKVIFKNGESKEDTIMRVGSFNLASDVGYLLYVPNTQQVTELAKQPERHIMGPLEDSLDAKDDFTMFPIDPSRGMFLSLQINNPTVKERMDQGGAVGYTIVLLAIIGVIITLERFVYLKKLEKAILTQKDSQTIDPNNPLGKILKIYHDNKDIDYESLELKIDEVLAKAIPQIIRGIKTLKLFTAMAPLLGLLGTVTGMIGVFQTITLFGTGDPKLLAGGISEALVTTAEGLITAIPLLLLHNFIYSKSGDIIEILKEESIGLIATRINEKGLSKA